MSYKPLTDEALNVYLEDPDVYGAAFTAKLVEQARRANRLAEVVSGYAVTDEIRQALAAYRGET